MDATFTITFSSLETMNVEVDAHMSKMRVSGGDYTAESMRQRYAELRSNGGQAAADQFLAGFTSKIRSSVESSLASGFKDATSREVTLVDVDKSTLERTSSSPTVDYTVRATVVSSRASLGVDTLSDEQVDAAFEAGATLRKDFSIVSNAGYKTTYVVSPPLGLSWSEPSAGIVNADGSRFRHVVDASTSSAEAREAVTLTLLDATAERATRESIATNVALAIESFTVADKKIPMTARVTVGLESLDVASRFPSALPAKVKLDFVTADGLRKLYAAGLVTDADLARSEAEIMDTIESALAGPIGASAPPTGGFDEATLAKGAAKGTPATVVATSRGGYPLSIDLENGKDVSSLFEAGAAIEAKFTLTSEPSRATVYAVSVPSSVEIGDASQGGAIAADKRSVTWTLDNRAGSAKSSLEVGFRIHDANAPSYEAERAAIEIVIDIKDVDVTVAKAAGGDFGNLLIDVDVRGDLGVMKVPDALKSKLPEGLALEYLSSDAVRVLLRDGLITEKDVDELDQRLLDDVKERLGGALGGGGALSGGLDRSSLAASLVKKPLSGDTPIVFEARISITKPLAGGESPQAGAAIALYTMQQTFDLPRVQGMDTTYKVLLPKGLAVVDASATGGDVTQGEEDGRDYFTVKPTGEGSAQTQVAMAITPTFVMMKFWPVVLGAVLLVLLIVAGPIVLVMRRRRAKSGASK